MVSRIANELFAQQLEVAGTDFFAADIKVKKEIAQSSIHHEEDPESMVWGLKDENGCHVSLTMDGVTYFVRVFLSWIHSTSSF